MNGLRTMDTVIAQGGLPMGVPSRQQSTESMEHHLGIGNEWLCVANEGRGASFCP
jgi:hypothetical protein